MTIHSSFLGELSAAPARSQLINLLDQLPFIDRKLASQWVGTFERTIEDAAERRIRPIVRKGILISVVASVGIAWWMRRR